MQAEVIWIDPQNRMVNFHAARKQPDVNGVRYQGGLSGDQLKALGYQEITIYERPDDYSESIYIRDEQELAPYVIYTRKPEEQIEKARVAKIDEQILALEKQALEQGLIRTIIDDLMIRSLTIAAQSGVTEAQLLDPESEHYSRAYAKVHANAAARAVLRAQR